MNELLSIAIWVVVLVALVWLGVRRALRFFHGGRAVVATLIKAHFRPVPLDNITICQRRFPFRVRADLQRAIDRLFGEQTVVCHFSGVRSEYSEEVDLPASLIEGITAALTVPPEYEEIDVGDEQPVRCLKRMAFGSCGKGTANGSCYWGPSVSTVA
ncbi:MAG: hypothetical protein WD847_10270 [Pirellulales bacterium]